MTLPVDYENATVSLDTHPDAHNETNAAVNALDGRVTTLETAAPDVTQAELDAHVNDTSDAHDASAISFSPTGTIAATDVQAAIAEVVSEAGSATILNGAGAPAYSLGAVGNYYLDTTNRILYGPKPAAAAEETVGVVGTPNTTNGFEWGVRTLFSVAGVVNRVRYYRDAGHSATITIRAWNVFTNAKITEIADTRAGQTGWFEVTFPTPVTIPENSVVLFSYGAAVVGYNNVSATYTGSAHCTNVGRFYSSTLNTFPSTNSSGLGVFVDAIFEPNSWPVAVGDRLMLLELGATPTNPTADDRILVYCKANKIVFAFNNAGTMRYKSLAMDAAGVTWVDHAASAP